MKNFKKDQQIFTIGLNMKCNKIIHKATFVEDVNDHEIYDCVIESGGIKSFSNKCELYGTRKEVKQLLLSEL